MQPFLLRMTLFIILFLLFVLSSLGIYMKISHLSMKDFPAPDLSDSYSFNEKMQFLKARNTSAAVISIGSSMTLNNLNSVSVVNNLGTDSYINAGSWGMTMKDNFVLLKILCSDRCPDVLVINSCVADFQQADKKIDSAVLAPYLLSEKDNDNLLTYLKEPSTAYYLKHFKYGKKLRTTVNDYEYLGFDRYGAVNFGSDSFNITAARWNKNTIANDILPVQYSFLDSIAGFCERKNIRLLFFQSPMRAGLYSKLRKNDLTKFLSHIEKENAILTQHHQVFVNPTNSSWKDNLFVDGTHLNEKGSGNFTDYCFSQIDNLSAIRNMLQHDMKRNMIDEHHATINNHSL